MDTPTVQIPQFSYDVKLPDIGSGYAAGITQAGKGIAAGLHDVLDVATQNRNATDTLQAMHQTGILSDDAYQAVAGKSLGAKQTMLGLYAGQWIAQQAQERELNKIGYTGQTEVATAHGKLLDTINAIQGKYGPGGQLATGVQPGKAIVSPQPQVRRAQPVQQPQQPPQQPQLVNPSGAPTPAVTYGSSPYAGIGLKSVGPPIRGNEPTPIGEHRQIKGPKGDIINGILQPDGTFRPLGI